MAEALPNGNWIRQITGGLSVPAIAEYLNVWRAVRDVHLSDDADRLVWKWTPDGAFTVKLAYRALHMPSYPLPELNLGLV